MIPPTSHDPEVDPGYVRELIAVIGELVDAAMLARPYVNHYRESQPGARAGARLRAAHVLEQLDCAIAEGQART